jgi:hypothetical protein
MSKLFDTAKMKINQILDANKQVKEKKKQKTLVDRNMKTKADRAPGSEGFKPTNTQIKSEAMVSRNVKGRAHPKYNEDMSNRITVTKAVGPDYKSKPTASDPNYNKEVAKGSLSTKSETSSTSSSDKMSWARDAQKKARELMGGKK